MRQDRLHHLLPSEVRRGDIVIHADGSEAEMITDQLDFRVINRPEMGARGNGRLCLPDTTYLSLTHLNMDCPGPGHVLSLLGWKYLQLVRENGWTPHAEAARIIARWEHGLSVCKRCRRELVWAEYRPDLR